MALALALVLALALALVLVGAGSLGAQSPDPVTRPSWEPPQTASEEVRTRIALRWGVEPGDLRLRWETPHRRPPASAFGNVELLGSGRKGRWMVSFAPAGNHGDGVTLSLQAGVMGVQAFARTPLARGDVLDTGNMEHLPHVHWGPPGDIPRRAEEGWVAQRTISSGELLSSPAVRAPRLVVSGHPVRIVWRSGAVEISLHGKAVGTGSEGDRVFVRTEEGHRMAGIVTGPGKVLVSNPEQGGGLS